MTSTESNADSFESAESNADSLEDDTNSDELQKFCLILDQEWNNRLDNEQRKKRDALLKFIESMGVEEFQDKNWEFPEWIVSKYVLESSERKNKSLYQPEDFPQLPPGNWQDDTLDLILTQKDWKHFWERVANANANVNANANANANANVNANAKGRRKAKQNVFNLAIYFNAKHPNMIGAMRNIKGLQPVLVPNNVFEKLLQVLKSPDRHEILEQTFNKNNVKYTTTFTKIAVHPSKNNLNGVIVMRIEFGIILQFKSMANRETSSFDKKVFTYFSKRNK